VGHEGLWEVWGEKMMTEEELQSKISWLIERLNTDNDEEDKKLVREWEDSNYDGSFTAWLVIKAFRV